MFRFFLFALAVTAVSCSSGDSKTPGDSSAVDSSKTSAAAVLPDSVRAEHIEKSLPDSTKLKRVSKSYVAGEYSAEGKVDVYYSGSELAWVVTSESDGSHCGTIRKYAFTGGKLAYYFMDDGCWFFDEGSPVDEKTGSSGTVDSNDRLTHYIANDSIFFTVHDVEKIFSTPGKKGESRTEKMSGPGDQDQTPKDMAEFARKWAKFADSKATYAEFFGEI